MNSINPILVCVTAQLSCQRLINSGKELSERINKPLYVVTVINKESSAKEKSAALKILNSLSKATGCSIDIIYSDVLWAESGYAALCYFKRKVYELWLLISTGLTYPTENKPETSPFCAWKPLKSYPSL